MKKATYFDRDTNREISEYEAMGPDGLLRDRCGIRVCCTMMDGLPDGSRFKDVAPSGRRPVLARYANPRFPITDGGTGYGLNRPGWRIAADYLDHNVLGDEAKTRITDARAAYERELTTAWRRGKEGVVPDAPKVSGNDATSVDDIETAYRLYAEEISQAWKKPG